MTTFSYSWLKFQEFLNALSPKYQKLRKYEADEILLKRFLNEYEEELKRETGKLIDEDYMSFFVDYGPAVSKMKSYKSLTPICLEDFQKMGVDYEPDMPATREPDLKEPIHKPTEHVEPQPFEAEAFYLFQDKLVKKDQDLVTFGRYPQGPGGEVESLEWLVLHEDEEQMLLVTKAGIDVQPFHKGKEAVVWPDSSIRQWLNNDFMMGAFDQDERDMIRMSHLFNHRFDHIQDEALGNMTEEEMAEALARLDVGDFNFWLNFVDYNKLIYSVDKVFLLSIDEASSCSNQRVFEPLTITAYARMRQGNISLNTGHSWWWLRSECENRHYTAIVSSDGYVERSGEVNYQKKGVVRPALWIDKKIY